MSAWHSAISLDRRSIIFFLIKKGAMRQYGVDFDRALRKVAARKHPCASVCHEGEMRWSVMGTALWLELQVLDSKTFEVSRPLFGTASFQCHMTKRSVEFMIAWAMDRLGEQLLTASNPHAAAPP